MKKRQWLKKISQNGGMTLVEVVLATVILGIIVTGITTVLGPTLRIYVHTKEAAETNVLMNDICNVVSQALSNASTEPTLLDNGEKIFINADGNITVLSTVNGLLCRSNDGADASPPKVFDEKYYGGKSVHIVYSSLGKVWRADVTLRGRTGDEIMTRALDVAPLVINQ